MKWLIYGIASTILFSFWGLFAKLSSFQDPIITNFFLIFAAVLTGGILILTTHRKLKFSKLGGIAGIFGGLQSIVILIALLQNELILVLPFSSAAGAIFFLIIYFTENPKYRTKQKMIAGLGLVLSLLGLFIISTASVGFLNFFNQVGINFTYISSGILIAFFAALTTYLSYRSTKFEKTDAANFSFSNSFISLIIALIALAIFNYSKITQIFSLNAVGYYYPMIGGVCAALGIFFTYKAFKLTTTKTKLQEAIIGILSNGELIVLPFLSYFILGEKTVLGYVGVIIVLIGLFMINYSEVLS
jgi:drug/metabolite transporter (DMT)-like permease